MPAESRNIRALLARRSGGIHRLDALQSQARKLYHHTTGDNFARIADELGISINETRRLIGEELEKNEQQV